MNTITIVNLTGNLDRCEFAADITQGELFVARIISTRTDGVQTIRVRALDEARTILAEHRSGKGHGFTRDDMHRIAREALGL